MNSVPYTDFSNLLPISLRLVRLVISVLLAVTVLTEPALSVFWQVVFSVLSLYSIVTGLMGSDPFFKLLRTSRGPRLNQALGVAAQLECFFIGSVCIVIGVMFHNMDSLVLRYLPFVGIYPILLCAVQHDLLGFLLQSYRRDVPPNKTG